MSDQRGHTLMEMLMALALSAVITLAVLTVISGMSRAGARVDDRSEATRAGRAAMQRITTVLRSQVCLGPGLPAVLAAHGTSVTFYSDRGAQPFAPEKHRLTFVPASGQIVEEIWLTNGGTAPAFTFPVAPSRTNVLAANLQALPGVPVFRYYAFTGAVPATPTAQLPVPNATPDAVLSAADRASTVQMAISFRARPASTVHADKVGSTWESHVYVRTADPLDPQHSPQCI